MSHRMKSEVAALAALCLSLAACAGAPTRIHTLDMVAPTGSSPTTAAAVGSFRIDAVHVPPAFDRPELIRRTDPYTVTLSDTDRWAAPLGELIRLTLTQDLAARLPAGTVIFPDAPKPAAARGLVIDILAIYPSASGGVDMEVSWTWITPKGASASPTSGAVLASTVLPPTMAHLSSPSTGGSPAAIASEISGLLAALADRIAAGRSS